MKRNITYNDYIVRVPHGEDVSRLSSFTQSMGWMIISLNDETHTKESRHRGLSSLRGVLKSNDNTPYDEMRREALNEKYGLEL